jgi:hypothetical protein
MIDRLVTYMIERDGAVRDHRAGSRAREPGDRRAPLRTGYRQAPPADRVEQRTPARTIQGAVIRVHCVSSNAVGVLSMKASRLAHLRTRCSSDSLDAKPATDTRPP